MNQLLIVLKTLPFALWGLFLLGRLPERSEPLFATYPLVTMMLALMLFAGGKPLWQIDHSPKSYLAQVQAFKSGILPAEEKSYSGAALLLGQYLFKEDALSPTLLISAVLLLSSLIIYLLVSRVRSPLSGLIAQYLFLLGINYHSRGNL